MCGTCGCGEHHHHHEHDHNHEHGHEHHHHHHDEDKVITLEQDILRRNNLLAERNRGYFEAKEIFCLNLMSSPGSGKTTCRTGYSRFPGQHRDRLPSGSRYGEPRCQTSGAGQSLDTFYRERRQPCLSCHVRPGRSKESRYR